MEDSPKKMKLDQIRPLDDLAGTCMELTHAFYETRRYSRFDISAAALDALFDQMKKCEEAMVNDAGNMLSLLSLHISFWLEKTVSSPRCGNQIVLANKSGTLSSVIAMALKWSQKNPVALGANRLLMNTILDWNHNGYAPKINITRWPKASSSCKGPPSEGLVPPLGSTKQVQLRLNCNRLLRHTTSTKKAIEILLTKFNYHIKLVSKVEEAARNKSDVVANVCSGHVWCGVVLTAEEVQLIPPGVARKHATDKRYGSVTFLFPISRTRAWAPYSQAYILGTRIYSYEYSQVLLVPSSTTKFNFFQVEVEALPNGKLCELPTVEIPEYEWILSYGENNGDWTHPELAFHENLFIPTWGLKLSFSDHRCSVDKAISCADCLQGINNKEKAILHFRELVNNHPRRCELVKIIAPLLDSEDRVSILGELEPE